MARTIALASPRSVRPTARGPAALRRSRPAPDAKPVFNQYLPRTPA